MSLHQPHFHITIYCPLWSGGLQQLPLISIIWLLSTTTSMLRLLGKWRKFDHNHTLPARIGRHKQKINHFITRFFPLQFTGQQLKLICKTVWFGKLTKSTVQKSRSRLRRLIFGADRCHFRETDFLHFLATRQLLDRSHHALMEWRQISSSSPCCRCHMLLGHSFGNQQLG